MSLVGISVPQFRYYNQHLNSRGMYAVADNFFNVTSDTWFKNLSAAEDKIKRYLASRDFYSAHLASPNEDLRDLKHTTWNEPVMQTMAGQFINHYVFRQIGTIIVKNYEHYDASTGTAPTKAVTVGQADDLIKEVVDLSIDLEELQDTIKNNIASVSTNSQWLDRQEGYSEKKDINPPDGQIVMMNPDLSKFKLTPEIIGYDAMQITGTVSGASRFPQELVVDSLLGWSYTGLSERTVGSPGDFNSIIMDILIKQLSTIGTIPTLFPVTSGATVLDLVFQIGYSRYESLLTSDLPMKLESYGSDFPNRDINPFFIGIIDSDARIPTHYLFWNLYKSVRTPFYDRTKVTMLQGGTTDLNLYNKFSSVEMKYDASGHILTLSSKQTSFNKSELKLLWEGLVGNEDGSIVGNLEKSLLMGASATQVFATLGEGTTDNVDKQLINRLMNDQLRKLDDGSIGQILTNAITAIYIMMFQLGLEDWSGLGNQLSPPYPLGGDLSGVDRHYIQRNPPNPPQIITIDIQLVPISSLAPPLTNPTTRPYERAQLDQLIAFQCQRTLRSVLGNRPHMPMGGLTYQWNNSIQVTRVGKDVMYPGDLATMTTIGNYTNMWMADLLNIDKEVQFGLKRLSQMYWWRDIVKWMEMVYAVLNPGNYPATREERITRYNKLRSVIETIYAKQLLTIRNYMSSIRSLGRQGRSTSLQTQEDPARVRERKVSGILASRTICYLKKQVEIIYAILVAAQKEPFWVSVQPTPPYPNMSNLNTELFSKLRGWFRGEIAKLTSFTSDPKQVRLINKMLLTDYCETLTDQSIGKGYSVSQQYITSEVTQFVTTDIFWKLLARMLKANDNLPTDSSDNKFYGIYLPVYTKSTIGNKYNYYLFDIMPYVLKKEINAGLKNSPQWLSGSDLVKTKAFPISNQGVIIIANRVNNISNDSKWKAINADWFQKVLDKANIRAKDTKTPERAFAIIRMAIYILLKDEKTWDTLFNGKDTGKTIGVDSNNEITVAGGKSDALKVALNKLFIEDNAQKRVNNRMLEMMTRDMVERDIDVAKTESKSISL